MTQLLASQLVSFNKDKYSYNLTTLGQEFLRIALKDLTALNYRDPVSGTIDPETESLTSRQLACLYVSYKGLYND